MGGELVIREFTNYLLLQYLSEEKVVACSAVQFVKQISSSLIPTEAAIVD
jgi:hypothetical protein